MLPANFIHTLRASKTLKVSLAVLVAASLLAASFGTHAALNDQEFLAYKQQILQAKIAGNARQMQTLQQQEQASLTNQDCQDQATARRTAAESYVARGLPPDPTRIIQNTTCFIDVASIRIPVNLSGVPFLDGLVSQFLNRMLSNSCGRLNNFFTDLRQQAVAQVGSTTVGNLALGYANNGAVTINGQTIQVGPNGQIATNIGGTSVSTNPFNADGTTTIGGRTIQNSGVVDIVTNAADNVFVAPTQGAINAATANASNGVPTVAPDQTVRFTAPGSLLKQIQCNLGVSASCAGQ